MSHEPPHPEHTTIQNDAHIVVATTTKTPSTEEVEVSNSSDTSVEVNHTTPITTTTKRTRDDDNVHAEDDTVDDMKIKSLPITSKKQKPSSNSNNEDGNQYPTSDELERTLAPSIQDYLNQGRRPKHRGSGTSTHNTDSVTTANTATGEDISPHVTATATATMMKYLPRPEWCGMPLALMILTLGPVKCPNHLELVNIMFGMIEHPENDNHLQRYLQRYIAMATSSPEGKKSDKHDHNLRQEQVQELMALVRTQLRSNMIYYDRMTHTWKTKHIEIHNTNTTLSEVPIHDDTQMTYEAIVQQQHFSKRNIGKDEDSILHKAIKENATMVALDLIRIEYNTYLEYKKPTTHGKENQLLLDSTLLCRRNRKGVTPLILAAQKGNLSIVQELLNCGASLTQKSINGSTAMLQAAHFGHVRVMECIIQWYQNSHERTSSVEELPQPWPETLVDLINAPNVNHTTPLMRAAQEGHISTAMLLLKHEAHVDSRNSAQMTPLMLAAQRGHTKMCRLLVRHGTNLDAKPNRNSTALLLACQRGHVAVVKELISAGCELHHTDHRHRTAQQMLQRRIRRHHDAPRAVVPPHPPVPPPPNRHRRNGGRRHRVVRWDGNDADDDDRDEGGDEDNNHVISLETDEKILQMLNPQTQLELMRLALRAKRNFELIRISTLFQRGRAEVQFFWVDDTFDITAVTPWLTETNATKRNPTREDPLADNDSPLLELPPPLLHQHECETAPFQAVVPSVQALIRAMVLPVPLVQAIASFLPLPRLWDKRTVRLESWTCENNPNEAVVHALDIIDEVFEEAGLLKALDTAKISAPFPHSTWHEWKQSAISNTTLGIQRANVSHYRPFWYITESIPPPPQDGKNPTLCELRRQAGYLPLLSKNESGTNIVSILMDEPYGIPRPIMQRLMHMSDVASLCRRCCVEANPSMALGIEPHNNAVISYAVNFQPIVASDIVELTNRFCFWYYKREKRISMRD